VERFLREAKQIGHLLEYDVVFVFGEIVLERHKVARLLESEGQFLGDEEEIVVINLLIFGLLLHCLHKGAFYLLVFDVLFRGKGTLLSQIHTYLFGIK